MAVMLITSLRVVDARLELGHPREAPFRMNRLTHTTQEEERRPHPRAVTAVQAHKPQVHEYPCIYGCPVVFRFPCFAVFLHTRGEAEHEAGRFDTSELAGSLIYIRRLGPMVSYVVGSSSWPSFN